MSADAQYPKTGPPDSPISPDRSQGLRERRRGQISLSSEALTSRAVELLRPEDERVCYDSVAGIFIGSVWIWLTRNRLMKWFLIRQTDVESSGVPGWVVARTRFVDDLLKIQVEKGIKQLVILGAGYDSRPYRFDKLLEGVKIFEVDRPDKQKLKMWAVRKTLKQFPKNLTYVQADLDSETLGVKLPKNVYDSNLKTLFIWEGAMMYLTPRAVDKTLVFITNNSVKGSIVVFDYLFKSALNKTFPSKEAAKLREHCARLGEPLLFGLKEESIEEFLSTRGFDLVENKTAQSLKDAYFKGRGEKRKVFSLTGIVVAKVKPH